LLATRFTSDVESELEQFEKNIRQYEQQSGKSLDDEVLLGIVINGLTDNGLRDHVIRNANRLNSYQAVRTELLEMARTSRVLSQMPIPMEVGAVVKGKGGKGKPGKGKEPKGKGKSQDGKGGNPKSKGKGSNPNQNQRDNPHKDKECHYCHKKGHLKADCRQKQKDDREKSKSTKYRSAAGAPEDEPQGEPLFATVDLEGESFVAGMVESKRLILVDTGAGSHLFTKDFDPNAHPDHPQVSPT
jgi:hypothetical protein